MNPKKLTNFGVIRAYCAALHRNGDRPPTDLMNRLYAELERRVLVGAMLHYLPVYMYWHEQGKSSSATAALISAELAIMEARHASV